MACMIISLGTFLITSGSVAFDAGDLQKLNTAKNCPQCDLSRADLRGVNLSISDMREAKLRGANLNGATWTDGSICLGGSFGECIK